MGLVQSFTNLFRKFIDTAPLTQALSRTLDLHTVPYTDSTGDRVPEYVIEALEEKNVEHHTKEYDM